MDTFIISESEALLLGRCLELYLQHVKDDPHVRFADHIEVDVGQFLPDLDDHIGCRTSPVIPNSIEWLDADGKEIGFSPERPQSVYYKCDFFADTPDGVYEVAKSDAPQTLELLVIDLVRDLLDTNHKLVRDSLPPHKWGAAVVEHYRRAVSTGAEVSNGSLSPFDENPSEIKERLTQLAAAKVNQQETMFLCGRKLGYLEACCRRGLANAAYWLEQAVVTASDDPIDLCTNYRDYEYDLGHWKALSPTEWRMQSERIMARLLQQPPLQMTNLSKQILEQDYNDHDSWCDDAGNLESITGERSYLHEILMVQHYIKRLHFAVGELIGRSHVADDETRRQDATSVEPRKFRLSRNSNADRIRGQLELVKNWLSSDESNNALGPTIAASLGPAIEALARRNWPEAFERQSTPDLPAIFRSYLTSGTEPENRFASTALNLYKTFRNPTQHGFDSVSCSPVEALHFFTGVRMLLQHSDTICASRRKDS